MNAIRASWADHRASVGLWSGWVTPIEAERLGALGYDWVLFDLEASGLHWDGLIGLIQAAELGGTRAMVRVPSCDPVAVMRALDYGAIGVVVPMVSTVEQARAIAAATRYPPRGTRANGQLRRPYASHRAANDDVVCAVMIETAEGWANLERIAEVDGIDVILIGQVDLALSLGWPLDERGGVDIARHPDARTALERLVKVARRNGKSAGAGTSDIDAVDAQALLAIGVDWLGCAGAQTWTVEAHGRAVRRWRESVEGDPR